MENIAEENLSSAQPSEFRQLINRLNDAIKKMDHFRGMTQLMTGMIDHLDVKMISDERAQVLGRVTAGSYSMMMCTVAMSKMQSDAMASVSELPEEVQQMLQQTTNQAVNQQLEGALPEYMVPYMKKMESQPITTILQESHALLSDLNAKMLVEFNPTLASTKYAVSYALQKIFALSQICGHADPMTRQMSLMSFFSDQLVETFKYIDQLYEGKVQLSQLAELFQTLKDSVQQLQTVDMDADMDDVSDSDIARLLMGLIPVEYALTEAMQINQMKMLEVSAEFYEAVQFSYKPTPEQQAKMMNTLPKLLRLMLAGQNAMVVGAAWQIDEDHFFENFFAVITDAELQGEIMTNTFARTMQLAPQSIRTVIEKAEAYCEGHDGHAEVELLQKLCVQYKHELADYELEQGRGMSQIDLQQASFTRFLSSVLDPEQPQVIPAEDADIDADTLDPKI